MQTNTVLSSNAISPYPNVIAASASHCKISVELVYILISPREFFQREVEQVKWLKSLSFHKPEVSIFVPAAGAKALTGGEWRASSVRRGHSGFERALTVPPQSTFEPHSHSGRTLGKSVWGRAKQCLAVKGEEKSPWNSLKGSGEGGGGGGDAEAQLWIPCSP